MTHYLKIKEEFFIDILNGRKTFELRKNDRNYQVGDLVHFINLDGMDFIGLYKHFDNLYVIDYVLKDVPEYGLSKGYCIFSIKELNR